MTNQPLHLLSFLVLGIWASKVFYENGRSRRVGLALGLVLHALGLVAAVVVASRRVSERKLSRGDWLLWSLLALIAVWLTWGNGRLWWGLENLDVVFLWGLVLMGLLDAWTGSERLSNLPLAFWLLAGLGVVTATALLGPRGADIGAYLGAWAWIVGGLLLGLVVPRDEGGDLVEGQGRFRIRVHETNILRMIGHYPIRGPLALLALTLLFLACLFAGYGYSINVDPSVYAFMVYVVMVGSALGLFLLFMAVVSLIMGLISVGRTLLRPPSVRCPRCDATHTDAERQAEALSPGLVQLRCPGCGKVWKQARLRW